MAHHLTDQEQARREEVAALRARGIDPYPPETYPTTHHTEAVVSGYKEDPEAFKEVCLAGRVMTKRVMGKASFAVLQDAEGSIQLYIARDELCPGEDKSYYNDVFKKLISRGDYVGVAGHVFTTQTGEITLHVTELTILSKALRPLPSAKEKEGEVYDAFSDPELRHRMRYVDLTVNPQVRATFKKRTRLMQALRDYMNRLGWLEVDTPTLQPIYGGALARPFTTYHNELEMTLFLRIANELYLKRLIVGGFEAVYEFSRNFRNEGVSRFHNPEFTALEFYVAYKDYLWLMDTFEEMLEQAAIAVNGSPEATFGGHSISFKRPWRRLSLYGAIAEYGGVDVSAMDAEAMQQVCKDKGIEVPAGATRAKLIDELFGELVEPQLIQPTIIMDYPVEMSPLAKAHRSKPGLVERFEVICAGKEIANAYSELNDPQDQRQRLEEQVRNRDAGDLEAMGLDEDFLRALEYGMPPTGGLGVGIERLAMILTGAPNIQEVLFFPAMRPEQAPQPVGLSDADLARAAIDPFWREALEAFGIMTLDELAETNPNKLFNFLGGWLKKNKIKDRKAQLEDVQGWISAAS